MSKFNSDYDPAKQVSTGELKAARDVLRRMLDGGELLASVEMPALRQAQHVLDESITAAARRAER